MTCCEAWCACCSTFLPPLVASCFPCNQQPAVASNIQHGLQLEHCYDYDYFRLLQNMFASSGGQLGKRLNRWVSSTLLYFLNIVYAAAALINFLGCLWYWVARREGVDNSWLISVGNDCLPLEIPQAEGALSPM